MPRELVAISLRNPVLREYEEAKLKPGEVRIRSLFSAPKHGSDLRTYRAIPKIIRSRLIKSGASMPEHLNLPHFR